MHFVGLHYTIVSQCTVQHNMNYIKDSVCLRNKIETGCSTTKTQK